MLKLFLPPQITGPPVRSFAPTVNHVKCHSRHGPRVRSLIYQHHAVIPYTSKYMQRARGVGKALLHKPGVQSMSKGADSQH